MKCLSRLCYRAVLLCFALDYSDQGFLKASGFPSIWCSYKTWGRAVEGDSNQIVVAWWGKIRPQNQLIHLFVKYLLDFFHSEFYSPQDGYNKPFIHYNLQKMETNHSFHFYFETYFCPHVLFTMTFPSKSAQIRRLLFIQSVNYFQKKIIFII